MSQQDPKLSCPCWSAHLEGVASVGVVPVLGAHAGLVAQERSYLIELFVVHVTVAVQVEHAEGDLEVAARSWEK